LATNSGDSSCCSLQLGQRQRRQVHAAADGDLHRVRHHLVRVAEGQALLHQVVGQVGGGGVAAQRGALHRLGLDDDAAHHLGHDAQRVAQRVDGVEQRLLVFLVVLVVGQRLALHQGQQAHQVADHAAALAARQLGDVGVALLRHDRRAGAVAVGQVDEAEVLAHPQHQLFGQARDVHHADRGGANSSAKSRSLTASRLFWHTPSKPSVRATRSRSSG
jgi:hypothetical protein